MSEHKRKIGERGQITIPKELRERHGLKSGEEIAIIETDDEIVLKPPTDEERLAEGYRKYADRSRALAEEMEDASTEATERLGDTPEWTEQE
ncbi:MAG: looped-hinge helix DNA binding domain, AbrB family [Halonotius sp. J07HN4]|jgi:looped-hinge helix DNA binding domain, AbrB family|nr:MAG: looped-hinge helix DNA binding domain, AbrB family [Halonotius sp. J07HN4]